MNGRGASMRTSWRCAPSIATSSAASARSRCARTRESGRARRFGGTLVADPRGDHGRVTVEHTYDERGVLRFALVAGRYGDARLYFDAKGAFVWQQPPPPTPADAWPVDVLVRDPEGM